MQEVEHMIGDIIADALVELLGQGIAPDTSSWSQQRRRRIGLVLSAVLLVLVLGVGIAWLVVVLTS